MTGTSPATTDPAGGLTAAPAAPAAPAEISGFLFHEAALIDDRLLDEWLALFTDDATYWVPQAAEDPRRMVSIIRDDRARIAERVARVSSGFAFSQNPPSRTSHLVGNVQVLGEDGDGIRVRSVYLVTATRRGASDLYSGTVEHVLVRTPDGLRIRSKTVRLIQSDLALGNLTFLL